MLTNVVYFYCNTLTIVTNLVFNLVKFKVLASLGSKFNLGLVPPPTQRGFEVGVEVEVKRELEVEGEVEGEFEWWILFGFDGVNCKGGYI